MKAIATNGISSIGEAGVLGQQAQSNRRLLGRCPLRPIDCRQNAIAGLRLPVSDTR